MDRCRRECVPVHNLKNDHERKAPSWSNGLCRPNWWRQGLLVLTSSCKGILFVADVLSLIQSKCFLGPSDRQTTVLSKANRFILEVTEKLT